MYMPIDFKTHQSKDLAFVNFVSEELASSFSGVFNGFTKGPIRCRKLCTGTWSVVQKILANVALWWRSSVMTDDVPEQFKFVDLVGKSRVPFPQPVS